MPFKTSVNWLSNDIWCYLVIVCFDWKIGVFQKIVLRGFIVSLIFWTYWINLKIVNKYLTEAQVQKRLIYQMSKSEPKVTNVFIPSLAHFMPLISFYTPWKHHKTRSFLRFSECMGLLTTDIKWVNLTNKKGCV